MAMKKVERFLVAVNEDGTLYPRQSREHQIVLTSLIASRELALRSVDDALPRNRVEVYKLVRVGYAYFGGDGGSYWTDAP